jgi:hypothetical protein
MTYANRAGRSPHEPSTVPLPLHTGNAFSPVPGLSGGGLGGCGLLFVMVDASSQ